MAAVSLLHLNSVKELVAIVTVMFSALNWVTVVLTLQKLDVHVSDYNNIIITINHAFYR